MTHPSTDEQADETVILVASSLFLSLIAFLRALAEQTCEESAARAPASDHPSADDQAGQPMLFVAALILVLSFLAFVRALAEQVREESATPAAASDHTSADK